MRLIDADALTAAIEDTDWYHVSLRGNLVYGAGLYDNPLYKADDIYQALKDAPTVDAVPVVRCKDCKYAERLKCGSLACVFLDNPSIPEDYFCADGERRNGDGQV